MRYFIEFSYNGKNYHGWQIQPNAITIQEKINTGISTILQEEISVVGAGRTDAGVHAVQMFAHFDVQNTLHKDFGYKLNAVLPNDIVIQDVLLVSDEAHARFDAISRSYEYRIWLGRNPFMLDTTCQIQYKNINFQAMNEAAKILYEYQDFECFSKVKTDVHTFICSIKKAEWKLDQHSLIFYITADRFLRNMVRAIVGTLLDVGQGKISMARFREIIESKNRCNAGVSVPAKGLFLTNVVYTYL